MKNYRIEATHTIVEVRSYFLELPDDFEATPETVRRHLSEGFFYARSMEEISNTIESCRLVEVKP